MLDSKTSRDRGTSLALVAIMREEARYLLEWVAYYRVLGVTRIVIYDNGENGDVLAALAEHEIVTVVDWPSVEGISPQLSAYTDAVTRLAGSVEFVTFLDADEFLVVDASTNLPRFLSGLPGSVGAVAMNQRVFGSAGQTSHEPGLTIERFQQACPADHPECAWGKSIYRLSNIEKIVNSHRNSLTRGRYVLADGTKAFAEASDLTTAKIDFSILQLNHYMLKSREEFDRKRNRGAVINTSAAARAARYQDNSFFDRREAYANAEEEVRVLSTLDAVLTEMRDLMSRDGRLAQANPRAPEASDTTSADIAPTAPANAGPDSPGIPERKDADAVPTHREKQINFEPWLAKTPEELESQKAYQASLREHVNVTIGSDVFISPMSLISGNVKLGHRTLIAANAILRGQITVGDDCSLNAGAHLAGKVTLGKGVRVASNAALMGFNHKADDISVPIYKQGLSHEGVVIGDNTWIGANAVILDGVTVGQECIIGAGAVVTASLPAYSVAGGNPARIISNRAAEHLKKKTPPAAAAKVNAVRAKIYATDPYAGFSDFRPLDMQGWGSYEPVFAEMMETIRPKVLVEVGTWKGASAVHQASLARKLGIDCEIVCVDTWLGNWQHWSRPAGPGSITDLALRNGFPSLFNQFMSNIILLGFQHDITPLALPGIAAAKLFAHFGLTADLVYIDGDHEYEAVSKDIQSWDTVLAPGGVLFGDDLHFPGVRQAIEEFAASSGRAYREMGGKFVFEAKR